MAGPLRVEHDVEVARWVQEALRPLDGTVASTISLRFEAHARLLHPAVLSAPIADAEPDAWGQVPFEHRDLTWAEAAELIGDRVGERSHFTVWLSRFGERGRELPDGSRIIDGHVLPDGGRIDEPHQGDIPLPMLTGLAQLLLDEHGDVDVLAAVWAGSGLDTTSTGVVFFSDNGPLTPSQERQAQRAFREEVRASIDPQVSDAMRRGRVLGLPREGQGRGHVLLRGRLSTFLDPAWPQTAGLGWREDWPDSGRTPNLLWPAEPHASPAWMVATDLDLDTTLIGGSARLIGRVLAHPSFEAERVLPTDPLV